MLHLHDVTLVLVDTQCAELARLALNDTLRFAKFAKVIVASNRLKVFDGTDAELIAVEDWADKGERERFIWYELSKEVHTRHWLRMQWDGWIVDPQQWTDLFLAYDYIGAPWLWHADNYKVGNGGFALHSKRLANFLREYRTAFPIGGLADDDICRVHRQALEDQGFTWAPLHLAERFAFEGGPDGRRWGIAPETFGFHGIWNFAHVLTTDEMLERASYATSYALDKAKQWGGKEFIDCFTEQFEQ
jgi:hypothetical protein